MAAAVHQLLAGAAPFDAVTGQALAWQALLAEHGIGGEIHAEHVHPQMAGRVRPLADFRPVRADRVVLRYSIWSAAVETALRVPRRSLGVVYHNATPGDLLRAANPGVADLCDRARRRLGRLAGRVAVAVADSEFNAAELRAAGVADVRVVPLLLDLPEQRPVRVGVAPIAVTVGRIAPNKRVEDAIRAIALLRARLPAARLVVIGSADGFEPYHEALVEFVERLGVGDGVRLAGRVDDAERDALMASAGAYLCTSEHEGFCAPLVEAMALGLPVVARGAAAVPETVGGAGLVLPGADAALIAEALADVFTNDDLRAELGRRGAKRAAELAPERVAPLVLAAVEALL